MASPDPIASFPAEIVRVQTMVDGSPRFVLGAPESAIDLLSVLARAKVDNRYLQVMIFDFDEYEKLVQESIKSSRKS